MVPEVHSLEEQSTFTSTRGWRLSMRKDESGGRHPEWRCPRCWALFKGRPPPR
jgi:hypothetical protein